MMTKLTRYRTFKALKSDKESGNATLIRNHESLSDFEAFLKILRSGYSNKKKAKSNHEKQLN